MQILSIICLEIVCVPHLLGCNGRVVLWVKLPEQIWHVFFSQGLQFFIYMYLRIGSNFSVQPSPVLESGLIS